MNIYEIRALSRANVELLRETYWVYFLWRGDDLVYIGFTSTGISRIASHVKSKKFDSYSHVSLGDEKEALALEKRLIRKFKPVYNRQAWGTPVLRQKGEKCSYTHVATKSFVLTGYTPRRSKKFQRYVFQLKKISDTFYTARTSKGVRGFMIKRKTHGKELMSIILKRGDKWCCTEVYRHVDCAWKPSALTRKQMLGWVSSLDVRLSEKLAGLDLDKIKG